MGQKIKKSKKNKDMTHSVGSHQHTESVSQDINDRKSENIEETTVDTVDNVASTLTSSESLHGRETKESVAKLSSESCEADPELLARENSDLKHKYRALKSNIKSLEKTCSEQKKKLEQFEQLTEEKTRFERENLELHRELERVTKELQEYKERHASLMKAVQDSKTSPMEIEMDGIRVQEEQKVTDEHPREKKSCDAIQHDVQGASVKPHYVKSLGSETQNLDWWGDESGAWGETAQGSSLTDIQRGTEQKPRSDAIDSTENSVSEKSNPPFNKTRFPPAGNYRGKEYQHSQRQPKNEHNLHNDRGRRPECNGNRPPVVQGRGRNDGDRHDLHKGKASRRDLNYSRHGNQGRGRVDREECDNQCNFSAGHDNYRDGSRSQTVEEHGVVTEIYGDLFSAPEDHCLAHCVAEDMRMGSGIAVSFRQIFKSVDELLDQRKRQGQVAVLEKNGRYIYYLVTKPLSTGKPTMDTLERSLAAMRDHVIEHKVTKIAMPRIGCGLDRLEWKDVKRLIEQTFLGTDVKITVYNYSEDPSALKPKPTSNLWVKDATIPVVEIDHYTAILCFCAVDGSSDSTITSLNRKFSLINEYRNMDRKLGRVKEISGGDYYHIYLLMVKETKEDFLSFRALAASLVEARKLIAKHRYEYVAVEAFYDERDEVMMEKIVTVMKSYLNTKHLKELWICWPKTVPESDEYY